MRSWALRITALLLVSCVVAALVLARGGSPFRRFDFSLGTAGGGGAKGTVILPKPAARFPVVVWLGGGGGTSMTWGQVLEQVAELGCAAVAIECDQASQSRFNEQLLGLQEYLNKQSWAQSNTVAWVGFGLEAQRSLSFLVTHPATRPRVYVGVGGGMVEGVQSELERKRSGERGGGSAEQRPESTTAVLLVHGERDEVYPVSECQRVGALLATNGTQVETRILAGLPHDLGDEAGVVMRAVGEYCVGRLPPADYAAGLDGCTLTGAERERFNVAMARAGRHRGELWKAVVSSREPERRTVMMVIGGLEDYDLAHISARHLREVVAVAWQARRTYAWCRDTPLHIFERFTAAPRALEEPLERIQAGLYNRLKQQVKYCRTTGEASDVVGAWRRQRVAWRESTSGNDATPGEVLASQAGHCQHLILLYTYLARCVGLPVRPVRASWSTLGADHYWVEVWDVEEKGWHSFDASAVDRTYYSNWVTNVPKAATHAATAERGSWNAARENRWEAYTNTVGLFYPSGTVRVRVHERETAKASQRVNVEIWKNGGMVLRTSATTDSRGEVSFTLGQSPRKPYRFVLDGVVEADWKWLAVQAGNQYELTLHTDRARPFDAAAEPPPLGFPEWKKPGNGRGQ